ncbi:hypothetical protein [Ligilactobacillus salivarius]|uniref:hypothetical protein n=1 Tax=Ligilactobacillus salivarius TaxID=1624 RepID=UPI0024BB2786|nr:hypothetical protein [Ligilactobacillus salivarius]
MPEDEIPEIYDNKHMTFEGLTDDKPKNRRNSKNICDEINVKLLSKFEGWEITSVGVAKALQPFRKNDLYKS